MGLGITFFVKSTSMYFITLCKEDLWFCMQSINLHMTSTKHIAHRAFRYLSGTITLVWRHSSHHLSHWVPQVCRTAYFWQMKLTIFTHRWSLQYLYINYISLNIQLYLGQGKASASCDIYIILHEFAFNIKYLKWS